MHFKLKIMNYDIIIKFVYILDEKKMPQLIFNFINFHGTIAYVDVKQILALSSNPSIAIVIQINKARFRSHKMRYNPSLQPCKYNVYCLVNTL